MRLTARQLNRATLGRQLLLGREPLGAVEAMQRIVAVQAQEPASPYIALWNRLSGFDPGDLDRAFATHGIVKATSVRITLHAVAAADYAPFHEAMQPSLRDSRLTDRRFTVAGLSTADADALVADVLAFAYEPRTNAEIEAWLDDRLGGPSRRGAWWALRTFAPFVHAPSGGPWSFGPRPAYLAAPDQRRSGDPEAALPHLVRRYLEGFGPASVQDVAHFARVRVTRVRAAVEKLGDELVRIEGPGGLELLDVPDGSIPAEDSPAPPRLMAMWDSTLLAYVDRSRIIPAEYRKLVTRNNGDVLPTLLVDGYVAGVWRTLDGRIEASAFHRLPGDAWEGLEAEASALRTFLAEREPSPYRRYNRWWQAMPAEEVRLL
jgi:hypothetical protein